MYKINIKYVLNIYMQLSYSLWFMMIGSFIIQMIVMSGIMTNSYTNITFIFHSIYRYI